MRNYRIRPVRLFKLFVLIFIFSVNLLAEPSLADKIGQMVMVGFSNDSPWEDTLKYDIEHRNLGGVLFFAHNLDNPTQIRTMTESLGSLASTPLLMATDQEGGFVARLDENNGYEITKTAYQLGTMENNEDSTRAQAAMMANWLVEDEINTNLAPVVDVNVNPRSPAIGYWERSFSADPDTVFQHAAWFINEFRQRDRICTLKHFPGHGSAKDDSHLGFTDISDTWSEAELVPYRKLIESGYRDMIMSGHLFNNHLDSLYPASLSKTVLTDLLRDSLGFQGVVISDEMFMRAIRDNYSFREAVILAINAGTDILLYSINSYNNLSILTKIVDIVTDAIDRGLISEARIDESYQRILTLKHRLVTSIAEVPAKAVPANLSLSVYPNPFNISTTIEMRVLKPEPVMLTVVDLAGRMVYSHRFEHISAGNQRFTLQSNGLASGIYFVSLTGSGNPVSQKITLIK